MRQFGPEFEGLERGVPCFIRKFLSRSSWPPPGDHMELTTPRVKPVSGEQSQEMGTRS